MNKKLLLIGLGLIVILFLWSGISIYPDWLWFENLGFSPVFLTMILSKFGFGFLVWLLLILIICLNLYIARRLNPGSGKDIAIKAADNDASPPLGLSNRALNTLLIALILILSLYVAAKGALRWDMVLRYFNQQPFGHTDPVFNKEIGFYIFSLPLYIYIQNGLSILFVLSGLITIAWYLKNGALQIEGDLSQLETGKASFPRIYISPKALKHLIFLAGIIVLISAWGYGLKVYRLLYSTQGPAFGASYTDIHIKILAYRLLIVVSLGFAVILFLTAFKFRKKLFWISGGIWIGSMLVFATGLPILVQKVVVKPNELAKESTYIAYNIEATRKAYNLNRIKEVPFEVKDTLSHKDIEQNDVTIQNIRIWDERPLLQTYKQIQSIRLYYDFNNVDVDRYVIDNQYRQLMLAARELDVNQLPPQANTWVNRHLIYTHGYGLASSPVNEVTGEGLPNLFVKDLPPAYTPDLKVERPEIYYGERTAEYVLVKTKAEEFDYPKGDTNVEAIYQGKGGVPITSFFRRLLYAIEFLDPQILFTTYLTPESRIMYKRRIARRTRLIAPFLDYDSDPYMVITEGKLYWIQDAYTTSDMYPYSLRSYGYFGNKAVNYIRNSVKVTIDAYNGNVCFYMMDEEDPIIQTYLSIFPDLFRPFSEMPDDLKKHIRYPRGLFSIQVGTYAKYHMDDVQVFYNQEDLWQVPDEMYGDSRQQMEPYYIILKLPEEEKEEFFLMLPFTPSSKDNMIGWLAARCDLPGYGNLLVYKLPKEKLVYGPMQIEARVDQQTEISRELSLWSQRGSRVIRGNLLAVPLGDTFIYVEPVYLEAKQEESESSLVATPQTRRLIRSPRQGTGAPLQGDRSKAASLPELKRVIAAVGNRLVMEENVDKALSSILGKQVFTKQKPTSPAALPAGGAYSLSARALEHYDKAKEHLRNGNWAGYGKELENLEGLLKEMAMERPPIDPSGEKK
ncbi:MAG: UPF0182 family protein [Deltaproteobacteria bacterium]|nr:UPF0182 family protein [Deltaproteobacteria bacterium]